MPSSVGMSWLEVVALAVIRVHTVHIYVRRQH